MRAAASRTLGGSLLGLLAALPLATLPLQAAEPELSLDEVLRRYEAARGGVAAWKAVDTLSASGIYASFSHRKPFKLEARRPNLWYFETESLGGATLWAHDEKGAYWIYPAYGTPAWPTRAAAPSDAMLDRWAMFEPPLLDAKAKGIEVKLLGRGDIDGTPTLELELKLPWGATEKWHLDANTFLETAVDATVFDLTQAGGPMNERAYPSDFRKVGGIVVPFKVEKEYLARYSLLEVEKLEVNQGWPAEKFRMPINAGMETLRPLAGEFEVKLELPPPRPNLPWQVIPAVAKITPHFDGAVLDETFEVDYGAGKQVTLRRWSWDRFDELYRILQNDDVTTHPNVFVGKLQNGKIEADDVATGSAGQQNGQDNLERFRLEVKGPDEIYVEGDNSADAGTTWTPAYKMTYTRKKN